ncbi:MAG TPA: FAD-binding protein [Candidatus Eisenbacteria bacterium]|jgi:FAD/FMN-containing dehydrogenase/ferredoxin
MTQPSFLARVVGQPLDSLVGLSPAQRAAAVRDSIPDLHAFLDDGRSFEEREAPPRTRELARSLLAALEAEPEGEGPPKNLRERIVTNALIRGEADRDQNVYLGKLFTRTLTRAVPDLVFQPASLAETACALRWGRANAVPVALRGAASTAMGGSVPNEGGLTLDLSRLDSIEIDAEAGVCVVGAGARLRTIHQRLAEQDLALRAYPSNLGGTLAGWFATGGIGMNAFGRGRALDSVRAVDVALPAGEHVRFHDDGRLDVPDGRHRRTLGDAAEVAAWFRGLGYPPLALADLARSEGVLGVLVKLTVAIEPRPVLGAFLISFETRDQALAAAEWIARAAPARFPRPANVKLFSGSHMHHTRRVWEDEDARDWRAHPSALSDGSGMPWKRIAGPEEAGAGTAPDRLHAGGYLFVDFFGLDAARQFARALGEVPGAPIVLGRESARIAVERFKPQQTKRLGPGLLAAEIVMPAAEVKAFLPRAEQLARGAGTDLDAEVYYLADGEALVIGGYLTDHRSGSFAVDLVIAPALVDLAMKRHRGRPYVLGRWQAAWFARTFGVRGAERLRAAKRGLDPAAIVNRGVLLEMRLKGLLGAVLALGFAPGVSLVRGVYASAALSPLARAAKRLLAGRPGPAHGRGEPAAVGARFRATPAEQAAAPAENGAAAGASAARAAEAAAPIAGAPQIASARALNCVNCGECNSVCPVFVDSKIRLPQTLTHLGEAMHGGAALAPAASALLDLCMRCGNCEEVCQAGIPHLPLYERMQQASNAQRPHDRERHAAVLLALRSAPRYREFLDIRPGGYVKRAPASLPGVARYLLLRAENDAGPAATCIHCGACVAVCPTQANHEFEGDDPRWITTDQLRCIGCGTCVEVCPANHLNGGQTLRVVEAPTADWFVAIAELERGGKA